MSTTWLASPSCASCWAVNSMAGKQNTPEIRFEGFTDPWEQRKLGEVASIKTGPFGSLLHAEDYVVDGIPIVTTEHFKSGFLPDEKAGLPQVSESDRARLEQYSAIEGDILFSRVGSVDVNAQVTTAQSGWLFSGRVLRARPTVSVISPNYLHYELSTDDVKRSIINRAVGGTMASINTEILEDTEIGFPRSRTEQLEIGRSLGNLDSLITLHQRKYNKLCMVKKSMLDKMFPKPGETEPEIRFEGFTDPWEQRKLGDVSKKVTTKNADGALNETFTNSAERGIVSQLDYFDHDITNEANVNGYYVVRPNAFVYNPRISTIAPCGPINRNRLNRAGVMSPLYTVFSIDDGVCKTYLEHYFKTSRWHDFMFLEGNTGARSDRFSISDSLFFEMPIWCPSLAEQEAIAQQLELTDNLIALHQRKLELLRNIKKSLLDRMFV